MDCLLSAEESVPGTRQTHQVCSKQPIKTGSDVHVPITVTSRSVEFSDVDFDGSRVRTKILTPKNVVLFYGLVAHRSHLTNDVEVHRVSWRMGKD